MNELLQQRKEISQRIRSLLQEWDKRMGDIQDELADYASANGYKLTGGRMPSSPLGATTFADIVDGVEVHLAERDEDAETLPPIAVLVHDPNTKVRVEFNTPPTREALLALITGLLTARGGRD
ncbi:hypothetical protein ACGFJC_47740 [Nonomuraea fuscirosea]|uniref:hypothetical protein n=1 Tax=Nonomuraea fuscirosea TaxID=1291556 RepID=UPI00371BEACD